MDQFDFHVANVAILQSRSIQNELKITEAQRKKMNVFADRHRARLKAYEQELKAAKQTKADPNRLMSYLADLKKGVLGEMSAAQLKRLREITLQMIGLTAIVDPVIGKQIGLSSAQQKKVTDAFADGTKRLAQAEQAVATGALAKYKDMKAKDKKEAQQLAQQAKGELQAAAMRASPRLKQIVMDRDSKISAALTPQQRAAFIALQGKKYTGKV
jgi:hypothetical protein